MQQALTLAFRYNTLKNNPDFIAYQCIVNADREAVIGHPNWIGLLQIPYRYK